jgi:membrane protein implicated in regulation of membrane protease activity
LAGVQAMMALAAGCWSVAGLFYGLGWALLALLAALACTAAALASARRYRRASARAECRDYYLRTTGQVPRRERESYL